MSDRPAIRPQNDHAVGHKTKMGQIFRSNPLICLARPFGGKAGPVRVLSTDVTTSV